MHANLKREYIDNWLVRINDSTKSSVLYRQIKPVFEWEYYLSHMPYKLRLALSRISLCNHKLPIDAGRYGAREDRVCTKCDSGALGDEYHFILTCTNPILSDLRAKYISPYYSINPEMGKLAELFNNSGSKLIRLARFVFEGLKIYSWVYFSFSGNEN